MNYSKKVFGLSLALVFFYLSISPGSVYTLPQNDLLKGDLNNLSGSWITETLVIYNLTKPLKNQQKTFYNLLIYSFKDFVLDLKNQWDNADLNTSVRGSQYIFFSKRIHLQLEVRTIIFPFHFFL